MELDVYAALESPRPDEPECSQRRGTALAPRRIERPHHRRPGGLGDWRAIGAPFVQYLHGNELASRPRLTRFAVTAAAANIAVSSYTRGLALAAGADGDCAPHPSWRRPLLAGESEARATANPADGRSAHRSIQGARHRHQSPARIKSQVPDVIWVVVGDGPLRTELVELAAAQGVSENIVFAGSLPDDERDAWFDRAHVFVMPSRLPPEGAGGEGFGIVYLEAGARLMPVVAGNVAGAVDAVVEGETGLLVDPTDPVAVADAVPPACCGIPPRLRRSDAPAPLGQWTSHGQRSRRGSRRCSVRTSERTGAREEDVPTGGA